MDGHARLAGEEAEMTPTRECSRKEQDTAD